MEGEMKLQDYIRLCLINIWKNKFLITAVTLLFALIGILVASWQTITNTYYARATVYTVFGDTMQETSATSNALSNYADVVMSRKVCERAETIVGNANITASLIKNMISTTYNSSSTVMTISAYSENPKTALEVANAVAEAFVTEIQSITGSDKIQMLDKAEEVRMSSNGLKGMIQTVLLTAIGGMAVSMAVIVAGVIFSDKIKGVEQCLDEDEEDVLGIIPFIE